MKLTVTESQLRQIIREELGQVRPLSKDSAELNRVKFEHDLARDRGHEGVARVRAMAQKLGRNFAAEMLVSDGVQLTIVGPDKEDPRAELGKVLQKLSSAGLTDDAFIQKIEDALLTYGVDFVIQPGSSWDVVDSREEYLAG